VASIADISYLFEEGMLVDYDTTEITKLLRALFAESQLREKAIKRIEQGHPTKSISS
jgi:protein transport protein DSL1/ZW10